MRYDIDLEFQNEGTRKSLAIRDAGTALVKLYVRDGDFAGTRALAEKIVSILPEKTDAAVPLPAPASTAWTINVRAIVVHPASGDDRYEIEAPWDVYDSATSDGRTTVRCDTSVDVSAADADAAIAEAEASAPAVLSETADRSECTVSLWVDPSIDVTRHAE